MLSHTLKSQISAQLSNVSQETLDAFAKQRQRNAEEYSVMYSAKETDEEKFVGVAQLAEHQFSKLNVAGSIPVTDSNLF